MQHFWCIYMCVCVHIWPSHMLIFRMWKVFVVHLIIIIILEIWDISHYLFFRPWNNYICCMPCYVAMALFSLMNMHHHQILRAFTGPWQGYIKTYKWSFVDFIASTSAVRILHRHCMAPLRACKMFVTTINGIITQGHHMWSCRHMAFIQPLVMPNMDCFHAVYHL